MSTIRPNAITNSQRLSNVLMQRYAEAMWMKLVDCWIPWMNRLVRDHHIGSFTS